MKTKSFYSLLIAFALIMGSFAMPAGAAAPYEPATHAIVRATDQFDETIPAGAILTLGDSVSLDKGETVSYDCTYTPRDASVKFGYISSDGRFYYLRGSNGSIDKGIQVSLRGSYTLAIKNESDETVSVWGTVNY